MGNCLDKLKQKTGANNGSIVEKKNRYKTGEDYDDQENGQANQNNN